MLYLDNTRADCNHWNGDPGQQYGNPQAFAMFARERHPCRMTAENYRNRNIMPLKSPHCNWNENIPTSWTEEIQSVGGYYDDYFASLLSTPEETYKMSSWTESTDSPSCIPLYPTAATKQIVFSSEFDDYSEKQWMTKSVKQWDSSDVLHWVYHVIDKIDPNEYDNFQVEPFRVDGVTLCSWTERDFVLRDREFGSVLYNALLSLKTEEQKSAYERLYDDKVDRFHLPSFNNFRYNNDRLSPALGDTKTLTELKVARDVHFTDSESDHSDSFPSSPVKDESSQDQCLVKKKRGRPVGTRGKRKPEKKCGRLWEFIRDLLLKPEYCPSLICWENHDEGTFRFVRSDKVAELWGTIKENPKMTYEKLSRAMRYYYKSQVLLPVFGRRLVYKFGPTAKGWRTDNPNFRLPAPCE